MKTQKRLKQLATVILAFVMLTSALPFSAAAAEVSLTESASGSDSKIYFKAPSFWNNYWDIRLYLYEVGGDVIIKWNSKRGKMTNEGGGLWSFDMSAYPMSDSKNYACIFLTNSELQTCDLLIGNPCLGDTAYCTGENDKLENTVDSQKMKWRVKWKNADPNRWGVPLDITSVGNVVGDVLIPGQSKYDLFLTFLKDKGKRGLDNAIKFNGKSKQQTIDHTAIMLGLSINEVKKAVRESGRSRDWNEFESLLNTPEYRIDNIKLNRGSLSLGGGESYGLIVESVYSYVPSDYLKQRIAWVSMNPNVAVVDNNGRVTGRLPGTAKVVAVTDNGYFAICCVTVKEAPASIKINPVSLTLGKGEKLTVSECTNSGSYANAANLRWSSSNTKVVTVSKQAGTNKAVLKAIGAGTANITVRTYNGKTATCKVTVKSAPTSVKLSNTTLTLKKGQSRTVSEVTNSGSYANASNLKWSSANTKVAKVTKGSGNKAAVKAVGTGTTYVKITLYNGKTAQCKVTVK